MSHFSPELFFERGEEMPEYEESDLRFTIAEPTETVEAPAPHTIATQPGDQPPTPIDEMQRLEKVPADRSAFLKIMGIGRDGLWVEIHPC
jgi:hypothetical protein